MRIHLACRNVSDEFASGLRQLCDDVTFVFDEPADLCHWAASQMHRRALVMPVDNDADARLVTELRAANGALVLIALLHDAAPGQYRRAIGAGATAAVAPRSIQCILHVLTEALHGCTVLPAGVVPDVIPGVPAGACTGAINDEQLTMLHMLAAGQTVSEIAREVGFSERTTKRRLRSCYAALGASNRLGALLAASRLGLLMADDATAAADG